MAERLRVLLVEDNPGDAFLIRHTVAKVPEVDFEFAEASRLSEAIRFLKDEVADLVLLDLGLPDSQGVETVRSVRKAAPWAPIVVLTGNDDARAGVDALKAGAQDYLVKGEVDGELLARVARYAMERHHTQEVLRESEKFLRTALDSLSAQIAIIDDGGAILDVNRAWNELAKSGLCALCEVVEGHDYLDWIDQVEEGRVPRAEEFAKGVRAVMAEKLDHFEMELECLGGPKRQWFHSRVAPFPGSGPGRAVVSHENITARKRAAEKLASSEARFRQVFDTSPNCIFIKDHSGRYLLANKATAELYGRPAEEIVGRTDAELFDSEEAGKFAADDNSVVRDGETVKVAEERFTRHDGTTRWFSTIKTPIAFPNDPDCLLGISLDITEQRKAREDLRNSELRLRTMLDAQTSKIVHVDTDLTVLWPNRAACEDAGRPRSEIVGKSCHEIWQSCAKQSPDCPVSAAIRKGAPQIRQMKGSDGRTWRVLGCPVRDDSGRIVSAVEIAEDITRRLSMEEQLRQAQKMEAIGALAGGIAHDFNNILSSIIGFTELALDEVEPKSMMEDNLREVHSAGKRAKALVTQILTFARRSEEAVKPIQLKPIAKEVLKFIRSSIPTSIEIRQRIESEAMILGNPTQVHQIFMNLCTNAAYALEEKGGVMEVGLYDVVFSQASEAAALGLSPGNYVAIEVVDDGPGIATSTLSSIFEPYFTTKGPGEGTGMGLAVVHGIVESYRGKIAVDSELGKGTAFKVYLPCARKKEKTVIYESETLPPGTERILFVDDEAPIVRMAGRILERLGYSVTSRTSSVAALELFRSGPERFDLVITDMTMPNMTGEKLAEKMREIRPDIPIILCTGYSKKLWEGTLKEDLVDAISRKPIDKHELANTVRRVLDDKKEGRGNG